MKNHTVEHGAQTCGMTSETTLSGTGTKQPTCISTCVRGQRLWRNRRHFESRRYSRVVREYARAAAASATNYQAECDACRRNTRND